MKGVSTIQTVCERGSMKKRAVGERGSECCVIKGGLLEVDVVPHRPVEHTHTDTHRGHGATYKEK